MQTENEKFFKPAQNTELHISNNIKICGIKYFHLIVIETTLYLYNTLIKNKSADRILGEKYLPVICLVPDSSPNLYSSVGSWLTYDGGILVSFGGMEKSLTHKIRGTN